MSEQRAKQYLELEKLHRGDRFKLMLGISEDDNLADTSDLIDLLKEVLHIHMDPNDFNYNECDKDPCNWCARAEEWIKLLSENA